MELSKNKELKHLVAIEYPGKVVNDDKMVETFGGPEELSKSIQDKQKLQLRFRQNFYAKSVFSSEQQETTGMLLKVKVRKRKQQRDKKPQIVSTQIVGTVNATYRFNNIADYQYLPIQKNEKSGKTENIYNDIVPQDITVGPSWFRENTEVPIFLPPPAFTRSDTLQPTTLKNETKDTNAEKGEASKSFAVTTRIKRGTHVISVPFSMNDPIPMKPNDAVCDLVQSKIVTQEEFDEVNRLFEKRPVWTLASIRAHMREPPKRLNFILAALAFYYSTGPWRNCFMKFGYDPKLHFESRFYQMIDFRVRQGAGFKGDIVSGRRPLGANRIVKVAAKPDSGLLTNEEIEETYQKRKQEAVFTSTTIPPFRARHYQLEDIHIPKIQDMLHKIPSPLSGVSCNEKRGWLPEGFMEQCRDILSGIASANMQKLSHDAEVSSVANCSEIEDMESDAEDHLEIDETME